MRSCFLVFAALVLAASTPSTAFAGTLHGSGGGFSGSGTFTATANGDGSYTINNLTGDASSGIQGLIPAGNFDNNDNLLFPDNTSLVDASGFAFTDSQGDTSFQVDIYADPSGNYFAYLVDSDLFTETIPVNFSLTNAPSTQSSRLYSPLASQQTTFSFDISQDFASQSPTPEPSSLVLLGTGLVALGGAVSRRRKS